MQIHMESYIGSACEVESAQNDLLLHGRLNAVFPFNDCTLEVVSLSGGPLIECERNLPVKLHFFNTQLGPLFLGGRVVISNSRCWQVTDVEPFSTSERRGFFRVKIDNTASVNALSCDPVAAHALSVSLSGAMFSAKTDFVLDQEVVLSEFRLAHDPIPFEVHCRVARIGEDTPEGRQYGCAFLSMQQEQMDRMCHDIFELQHMAVRSRHNRN